MNYKRTGRRLIHNYQLIVKELKIVNAVLEKGKQKGETPESSLEMAGVMYHINRLQTAKEMIEKKLVLMFENGQINPQEVEDSDLILQEIKERKPIAAKVEQEMEEFLLSLGCTDEDAE